MSSMHLSCSWTQAENRTDFMSWPMCEPCMTARACPAEKVSGTDSYTHAQRKTWYQEKVKGLIQDCGWRREDRAVEKVGRIETSMCAMMTLRTEELTYFQMQKQRVGYSG